MSLTADQRKKLDETISTLKADAMRTDPIDPGACVETFGAAYGALNLSKPEIVICSSPLDALQRLDAIVPESRRFRDFVGDEVFLCRADYEHHIFANRALDDHPLWEAAGRRVDKSAVAFVDLANAVDAALEKVAKRPDTMLHNGNNSFWNYADNIGALDALAALGVLKLSRAYTLGRIALASCNQAFAYERYCFISDRPQGFTHPQLFKDGPRDRITARWRDGFVCDEELWF